MKKESLSGGPLLLGIVGYICRMYGGKIKRRRLVRKCTLYVAFIRYIRFQR